MKEKELLNNDKTPLGFENKGIEIISKRGKREKHFLQKDGSFIAQMYSDDIHFKKNGKYEEIDNRLEKVSEYYKNKNNSFDVYFKERSKGELLRYELQEGYIGFELMDDNDVSLQIIDGNSKFTQTVKYENIFGGIDFEYLITPTKVKENIIIKEKEFIPEKISFILHTNFELKLTEGGNIVASMGGNTLFTLDVPYMIDSTQIVNNNIRYELNKQVNGYILDIWIDEEWLNSKERVYPIIVDPTISTNTGGSIMDTYIYPGDMDDKCYEKNILKAGVERINGKDIVNRTLLKFELPKIGTGSQIYSAGLSLIGYYPSVEKYTPKCVDVHRITCDWKENEANWDNMSTNFDNSKIESSRHVYRCFLEDDGVTISPFGFGFDITSLVQKWYADTQNYGIMLKSHREEHQDGDFPAFFSQNNSISGYNPKPNIIISYRNYNGIEVDMNLQSQKFSNGIVYENLYNGNVIAKFALGSTSSNRLPVNLGLVYNTNDVVLGRNIGYGLGYRLNLQQIIESEKIGDIGYLKYTDDDGTIHYFVNDEGIYKDEDNLGMIIKDCETYYTLTDRNNDIMKFDKIGTIGYLTEYKNLSENKVIVTYNSDNLISKVIDADGYEINIFYEETKITCVSPTKSVVLNYEEGKMSTISYVDGVVTFLYDKNGVIRKIKDKNGTSVKYEYYEQQPYRVKKVTEYGTQNGEGASFTLLYAFNSTTIVDNNDRSTTINFNFNADTISTSKLKGIDNVDDAYGTVAEYGEYEQYSNRILSTAIPSKYVKNILNNTGFERDDICFTTSDPVTMSISSDIAYEGYNSLKIVNFNNNECIKQEIEALKGKSYTFSAYMKSTNNLKIALGYEDENNRVVENESDEIFYSDDFKRHDVTIYYPDSALSKLYIKIYFITPGVTYMDNVQLEEGEVANNFNYIENSDFSRSLEGWDVSSDNATVNCFEIVNLSGGNGTKAVKIKMDPEIGTSLSKTINVRGKKGDSYNLSFWYKNTGIDSPLWNHTLISFNYTEDIGTDSHPTLSLNPNPNEWQYFSISMVALTDYDSLEITLFQNEDANELFVTNISLFKDIKEQNYDYDNNGNIISIKQFNDKITGFNYDRNNQLIKMLDPKGKRLSFEYDNKIVDRVLSGLSESGISNQVNYAENGNPIFTRIVKTGFSGELMNGLYRIRLKGTQNYLKSIKNRVYLKGNQQLPEIWNIIKDGDDYKIFHSITSFNLNIIDGKIVLISTCSETSKFNLIKNDNGSYLIKPKNSEFYVKNDNDELILSELVKEDSDFQFFFETIDNKIFIENNALYTEDGRFISKIIDSNLNEVTYRYDFNTGLLLSSANAKNNTIFYDYDENERLKLITNGNKVINYQYNENGFIENIIQGDKKYCFVYDEFLNIKTVKIGDKINFITNNYEKNNGKLISIKYGNNHTVNYEYDEFDRIVKIINMDDIYHLKYGGNGELLKIVSNHGVIRYNYDLAKRLVEYIDDEFVAKYDYDSNNNIVKVKYILNNFSEGIENILNEEDLINKTLFGEHEINYSYDPLGRLIKSSVDGKIDVKYSYKTNGNRASLLVDSLENNLEKYSYRYDQLNNITHIYYNDILRNQYYYDQYEQLIREDNYLANKTIRYIYDLYGNILSVREYYLNSYNLIDKDDYKYNNESWVDQLTEYNNQKIVYDDMGNPVKIGDGVVLNWINGRQLYKYIDNVSGNNVNYKYNKGGIRTSKTVKGVETKYYLESNKVVLEKTAENVLYYIRNNVDDLIAFKYNNDLYYYLKNDQDDIVALLDSDHTLVARYEYDSWGNIVSITDGNGNDVRTNDVHIANINPFRYRSYYYDKEIGMYYLNTRYYNPTWRRFLNADSGIMINKSLVGNNLYAYVDNNPINKTDENGNFSLKKLVKKIAKKVSKTVKKVAKVVGKVVKKAVSTVYNFAKSAIAYTSTLINRQTIKTVTKQTSSLLPVSSALLSHSASSNPVDINWGNNSYIAKTIKKDNDFQSKMKELVKDNPNGSFEVKDQDLVFNSNFDLMMALHGTSLYAEGNLVNGKGVLHVTIVDSYDFEKWDKTNHPGTNNMVILVNNAADALMDVGVLNDYDITISFDYYVGN